MSRLRPRLTYANVMSSIAVFAALTGGVAWAHGKIGTNDLRNGAVTTPKLANNAVTTPKLRNNAVRAGKLADAAVQSGHIADAAVGARHIEEGAIDSSKVLAGSLLGSDIDQESLDDVDAARLGGTTKAGFGAGVGSGRLTGLSSWSGGGVGPAQYGPPGGIFTANSNEAQVKVLSPATDVVVRDLSAKWTTAAVPASSRNLSIQANGGSVLSCTAVASSCQNAGSAVIPAGSELLIRYLPIKEGGVTVPGGDVLFAFRLTMP